MLTLVVAVELATAAGMLRCGADLPHSDTTDTVAAVLLSNLLLSLLMTLSMALVLLSSVLLLSSLSLKLLQLVLFSLAQELRLRSTLLLLPRTSR